MDENKVCLSDQGHRMFMALSLLASSWEHSFYKRSHELSLENILAQTVWGQDPQGWARLIKTILKLWREKQQRQG
jgi:hypothetical protein